MGGKATLAEAKKELEELYLGVPDESVNLTFQDFAQVRQHEKKKLSPSSTISENPERSPPSSSPLAKLPSLDFSKGLEASSFPTHQYHRRPEDHDHHHYSHHQQEQRSTVYDDMSHVSVAYGLDNINDRGGRRRPGIPHSNICAICCNYIYICRHRCLVCGRVYCRQCVSDGMGEMIEGRKCIDCLGRRFSQRYIHKAGNVGWCMGYASVVKQQELKWAERGARRTGDNRYGNNSVMAPVSRSRSPVGMTLTRQHLTTTPSNPPSFVINSPYSPTSHHPMPF